MILPSSTCCKWWCKGWWCWTWTTVCIVGSGIMPWAHKRSSRNVSANNSRTTQKMWILLPGLCSSWMSLPGPSRKRNRSILDTWIINCKVVVKDRLWRIFQKKNQQIIGRKLRLIEKSKSQKYLIGMLIFENTLNWLKISGTITISGFVIYMLMINFSFNSEVYVASAMQIMRRN